MFLFNSIIMYKDSNKVAFGAPYMVVPRRKFTDPDNVLWFESAILTFNSALR